MTPEDLSAARYWKGKLHGGDMASMERKWEECFGDTVLLETTSQHNADEFGAVYQFRPCKRCQSIVMMWGDEPGMDHVRLHDELDRGLHP